MNCSEENIQLIQFLSLNSLASVSLRFTNQRVQMDLQVKDIRSTCSCGTQQDRRGRWSTLTNSFSPLLSLVLSPVVFKCVFSISNYMSYDYYYYLRVWIISGSGVWQQHSLEMQWVSFSCLTSQMSKVSSMLETGWVCLHQSSLLIIKTYYFYR